MRIHMLLSMSLLGLLLWASCIQASDQDTETPEEPLKETEETASEEEEEEETESEEAPKKEKTTDIEEENDVMVLHINNFDRALSETKYLLVEFYAPWCGHCKRLEPVYAEAAARLKEEDPALRLAKVDVMEEKELAEEFDIGGFPTLKLFINGDRKQPVDYNGKRSLEGMIQWMKRRAGPGAPVLDSTEAAAQFIDAHNIAVVGFFDSLESEAAKVFKEVPLEMTDTEFALTASPEVFQKYEVKENSVVLFKKFDEPKADFVLPEGGELNKTHLITFINENSMDLIIPFSQEISDKIFNSHIRLHTLLFINSTVESQKALLDESRTLAKEFKGKLLFVSIDVTEAISHILTYFGVSGDDTPTVRIINVDTTKKFKTDSKALTTNSLRQLCQAVVDGTAQPYYRTEEIPEDWNKGPVKVLVGKNFESVTQDPTKNVFVEFYAPWCGHCKELAPIWEQLGEKYADHEDIIIAKLDATANELEAVKIEGFPTLKYFPAGGKEVVDYIGKRDLETLSKFLDDGGVLPEEESIDEEDEIDEEADDAEKDEDTNESAEESHNTTKDEL